MSPFLPDADPPFHLRLGQALRWTGALCFISAAGAPVYLWFRAGELRGSRTAAGFVAEVVLLSLAWTTLYLVRERGLPGTDWEGSRAMTLSGTLGGGFMFLGAWILIWGHWAGIVLVLLGTVGVVVGLRMLRLYFTAQFGSLTPAPFADRKPGSTKAKAPEWMPSRDWLRTRTAARAGALLASVVFIAVVNGVFGLHGAAGWAVALGVFSLLLAEGLLPRFWRWRGMSGRTVNRQERVKRFEWRWFDRGFVACVVGVLAVLMAIQWLRTSVFWAIQAAAFVLAAALIVLGYEGLRRSLWAPRLSRLYSRVDYCSHCGKEAAHMAIRCPACSSMFGTGAFTSRVVGRD